MAIVYVYAFPLTTASMRTHLALCYLVYFQSCCLAQDGSMPIAEENRPVRNSIPFFIAAEGIATIPVASLKSYSKGRAGLSLAFNMPLKVYSPFSVGLELGGIFSGTKDDIFRGLDVETSTMVLQLQPILRYIPRKKNAVNPCVDLFVGIMAANTSTTSEIIEEPTFLERVLFGAEEDVETITHQRGGSTNLSYGIGFGLIIKDFIKIGVRYQHTNPVDYINTSNVYVINNTIQYEVNHIPLDMVQISFGLGKWRIR